MSAAMADRFEMVSSSDSPLLADERAMSRLITSALRRLAAISKVVRVRVLFSKNRLNTLLPRSSGTFLTSRSLTDRNVPAVSRMWCSTVCGRPSMDSRWISSPWRLSCGLRRDSMSCNFFDGEREAPDIGAGQREFLRGRQRDLGGREGRLDGQLAPTAVDENRQA